MTTQKSLPTHVAIIMDGNRRWAKQHKLQVMQGHQFVADKVIEDLVAHAVKRGIQYVTLWAFSTENWHRDKTEVDGLMKIFREAFGRSANRLYELGVRLNYIGDLAAFPTDIQEQVQAWIDKSRTNDRITLTFALNYGGRDELVRAVNQLLAAGKQSVTEADISAAVDTSGLPDPDLIIRPGGEQRLSGFLTWQSVYSEWYFTDVLMPDFTAEEFDKALAEFAHRQRRFGR